MRKAPLARKTNEVDINGTLVIDGEGQAKVSTGFEPLNHLLTLFAFHGLFDLELNASGDLQHHIIEDIGIALGKAFKQALGDKSGINRYGSFSATMDKVVVEANVDISGRPSLEGEDIPVGTFDDTNFTFKDAKEFLESFTQHAGISLVYIIKSSKGDLHHLLEALFKAMGKALDQATQIDPRRKGIPSTKGIID
ncbi:MAG: imidazoleglycerol-phosphate dehydratase [Candidatus Omnitrophica bacterium]|nr:imidazoleglycerol-phosphate dehydratase [Candidatus Omnitrophota bacterium]MBU2044721.1 imidazoleglycerol-phosphate dehydratase [Candidatus Omnitrophota bacterium]MBU2250739.1 imidazoleglycerol-phosphate dehydratase [Candidatus Omnitrophota bacterium]MBU2473490.1 imidazoleglycerol-phosphate dehydratase [Candidatus Omnitrophota bacterium]